MNHYSQGSSEFNIKNKLTILFTYNITHNLYVTYVGKLIGIVCG